MSTYVRQFLERIDRPDVDEIDGILPAIAIEQKNTVKNARSTVATATELADHIRLFMTYAGETICPDCQVTVRRETPESITAAITSSLEGKRVVVLAPIFFEKENRGEVLTQLVKAGFYRAWIVVFGVDHIVSGVAINIIAAGRRRLPGRGVVQRPRGRRSDPVAAVADAARDQPALHLRPDEHPRGEALVPDQRPGRRGGDVHQEPQRRSC